MPSVFECCRARDCGTHPSALEILRNGGLFRGRLVEEFYDELERRCTEAIELSPGGPVVALNIPIGQWHTVRALESGTVIMEVKDGPYEPTGEEDILAL